MVEYSINSGSKYESKTCAVGLCGRAVGTCSSNCDRKHCCPARR